jgi:ABC-2 type transport system permease protein
MVAASLPYRAVIAARFRVLLQDRAAAAAGFATQVFWGFIRVMVFEAFYRSTTAAQPMSFPDVVTYIWLGQATLALFPWTVDPDIRGMVRTGDVSYELLRPVDLYGLWYSRALAMRAAPTLLRAVPMLICATLFFGLRPPPSVGSGLAWVAVTLGALLLAAALTQLMNISLLWTTSAEGVSRLMPTVAYFFSGMVVPLPFYPDWAQSLIAVLPFRGLADGPFRVFSGHLPLSQAPLLLAHQLLWTLLLVLLGRWLLNRATQRMAVQGG